MTALKTTPRKPAGTGTVQRWLDFGWWLAGDAGQNDFARRDGHPAIRYQKMFTRIMARYFSDLRPKAAKPGKPQPEGQPGSGKPAGPMSQEQMRAAMLPRFMRALQQAFSLESLDAIAAREPANFHQLVRRIRADFASQAAPAGPTPRILHLEDSARDAELIRGVLQEKWPDCQMQQVWTRDEYERALKQGEFNLILSDHTMPGFDGLTALELAQKHRPRKPFIFLSGTLGEERAVEAIKQGATDYVIKSRLGGLIAAIRRALT